MRVVVAYDLSDDRERRRLFQRLHDFGHPVELSVFELDLGGQPLAELWRELLPVARGPSDRIVAYPLCASCHARRLMAGTPLSPLPAGGVLIVDDALDQALPASDPDDYSLLARVVEHRTMWHAWRRVRANRGCAGTDGVTIGRFETMLRAEFRALQTSLLSDTYRPRPLRIRNIPKRNGGVRRLAIPCVRDRVLQTAVASVVAPLWEHEFSPASFAYRPKRSVSGAIRRLRRLRAKGLTHVVLADIDDFFDEIDHTLLLGFVAAHLDDMRIVALVERWIALVPGGRGVPQGSPIAPLLSNIYLDAFDDAMLRAGWGLVRYADDLAICCASHHDALAALARAQVRLAELGLRLNPDVTITTFAEGFDYLGKTFVGQVELPGSDKRSGGRIRWRVGRPRGGHRAP